MIPSDPIGSPSPATASAAASPTTPLPSPDTPKRSSTLRVGLAAGVGTSLEFYDFAIYGTAAALVFGEVFFQTGDPWFGTFMSLTTFAIGFLMAPVGAAIFGWIGDRRGRRAALLAAFVTMGVSTLLMGLLPSYAVIGVAAPILLVLLRLCHGAARGGENQSAAVFAMEHAPEHRRGLFGSFVAVGSPIGSMLANLAFALVLFLPEDAVQSWGWRIPFLVGGGVLAIGLWIRHGVDETPEFEEVVRRKVDETTGSPLREAVRTGWRRIALVAGVNIGLNASTFTLATFMLSFGSAAAPLGLGLPRQQILLGTLLGLACHAVANVVAAMVSDRVGRRPVMAVGAVASLASALTMFHLTAVGTVAAVNLAIVIGFICTGVLFGPMYTFFGELFPAEQRATAAGVGFHVGAVLGGGLAPLVANRIIAGTEQPLNVGYYLAALLVVTLLCLRALPETAPCRVGAATPVGHHR